MYVYDCDLKNTSVHLYLLSPDARQHSSRLSTAVSTAIEPYSQVNNEQYNNAVLQEKPRLVGRSKLDIPISEQWKCSKKYFFKGVKLTHTVVYLFIYKTH